MAHRVPPLRPALSERWSRPWIRTGTWFLRAWLGSWGWTPQGTLIETCEGCYQGPQGPPGKPPAGFFWLDPGSGSDAGKGRTRAIPQSRKRFPDYLVKSSWSRRVGVRSSGRDDVFMIPDRERPEGRTPTSLIRSLKKNLRAVRRNRATRRMDSESAGRGIISSFWRLCCGRGHRLPCGHLPSHCRDRRCRRIPHWHK